MVNQYCEYHRGLHNNVHEVRPSAFTEPRCICRDCLKVLLADHSKIEQLFGAPAPGLYLANPFRKRGWIWLSEPRDIPPFC